jgi:hypothetical protein
MRRRVEGKLGIELLNPFAPLRLQREVISRWRRKDAKENDKERKALGSVAESLSRRPD